MDYCPSKMLILPMEFNDRQIFRRKTFIIDGILPMNLVLSEITDGIFDGIWIRQKCKLTQNKTKQPKRRFSHSHFSLTPHSFFIVVLRYRWRPHHAQFTVVPMPPSCLGVLRHHHV